MSENLDTPYINIAYILNEMNEVVKNPMTGDMTEEGRAVEKFCKDMIKDFALRLTREVGRMNGAVLAFCDAFTLVYPPGDKDCPALLDGAFKMLQDELGIETIKTGD